jgi:hypothetical protein
MLLNPKEDSPIKGTFALGLILTYGVQKSSWSTVTIFPWWGNLTSQKTLDAMNFMA